MFGRILKKLMFHCICRQRMISFLVISPSVLMCCPLILQQHLIQDVYLIPRCILDEPLIKFWYKLDSTFKLPYVNTYFRINLKGAYDDVKSCGLTSLYLDLLTDQLNEILYEACVASLGTSFSLSLDKLQLEVYSFNDKLPALLSKILETIKSFLPTDDRFEVFKEGMERAYTNTNMDPWSYSTYLRDQVLLQKFYTLYFQIEQAVKSESVRLKVLIDLFQEILQEPLFNQLRTKEQLGYVVLCGQNCMCNVFGFYFCVQSSEYNPIHLQGRQDNLIDGLEELLEGLDDDSFENYKGGLMAKVLEKDAFLTSETNRLWTQILDKWCTFDYSKKAAEQLRSIQKKDVTKFYKTYLQQSSPKRRRLATRNTDLKEAEEARPESVQVIEDLAAFKMSSKFYDVKKFLL